MLIDKDLFKEIASRGVSQKTWDNFTDLEKKDYIKKNPTSKYANPNNTLPTTINNPVIKETANNIRTANNLGKCLIKAGFGNDYSIDINASDGTAKVIVKNPGQTIYKNYFYQKKANYDDNEDNDNYFAELYHTEYYEGDTLDEVELSDKDQWIFSDLWDEAENKAIEEFKKIEGNTMKIIGLKNFNSDVIFYLKQK